MDLNLFKKLIRLVEKSEITEFSVEEGDLKIKIAKNLSSNNVHIPPVQSGQNSNEVVLPQTSVSTLPTSHLHEIRSPIVGTFYRSPAPEANSFVKEGDKVSPGKVLCIVEAMKLMNEIECDVSGQIVQILVENGKPVEYNQPLFLIEED